MAAQLGGQQQPNHCANSVAMKTVSSNHVAADQVFRNITSLPHLHIDFAVWYIVVYSDGALPFRSSVQSVCVALRLSHV